MNRILKIDTIARGVMAGYYGCKQNAGTEFQKWTHAVLQADQIYKGDLVIDADGLSEEAYHYCKNNNLIQ
jgi:hypothetical protein